jgi:hypothetical protein
MVAVVLWIILGIFTPVTFINIIYLSIAVTVISYVIGDLLILPATNNTAATIADFIIALAAIYLYNFLLVTKEITFWISIVSAAVIGIGEWFFHSYVHKNVIEKD